MNANMLDPSIVEIDAASRLAIYMINHANSPLITQCGDLTHDAFRGGFYSTDGRIHVAKDASYYETLNTVVPIGAYLSSGSMTSSSYAPVPTISQRDPVIADSTSLLPSGAVPAIPNSAYSEIREFHALSPHEIPYLLSKLTNQYDVVYVCNRLGLFGINYDKISEGIFIRSYADNLFTPPIGGSILHIFNSLGSFVRANAYYQWTIYELKVFKYTTRPGLYPFLFRPEHSGIWFNTKNGRAPLDGPIVLDTIGNLLNRTCPANANAGLIDAGDLKYLDWEILRWHPVILVWHSEESLLSCNHFAAAMHFVSEAMKHGLVVSVFDNATNTLMGLQNIIQQACRFNLKIPQNMNIESTFNKEFYNGEYFNS